MPIIEIPFSCYHFKQVRSERMMTTIQSALLLSESMEHTIVCSMNYQQYCMVTPLEFRLDLLIIIALVK